MYTVNRPYDFVRDHINIHDLNRKQTNIRHHVPSNRIRWQRTKKEIERRPKGKKKTVHNKKRNGRASTRKKRRKEEKKKRNGTASARNENARENRIKTETCTETSSQVENQK